VSDQSPQALAEEEQRANKTELMVNDFSIQIATVNGSGSQSSNSVLMRSIFQMGIPVSGKNLFPSNIAGLPTWFTIRANKDGWIARKKEIDFLVAMNADTAREDVMALDPGRVVVYEETLRLNQLRKDLTFFPVPFAKLATGITTDSRLRKLLANMIYVGVVGELMEIDPAEMETALTKQFKGKAKAVALNKLALEAGRKFAQENLDRHLVPFRCQRWAVCLPELRLPRGIRSRPHRALSKLSPTTCTNIALVPMARQHTPSSRQKTNWPLWVWPLERDGPEHVP